MVLCVWPLGGCGGCGGLPCDWRSGHGGNGFNLGGRLHFGHAGSARSRRNAGRRAVAGVAGWSVRPDHAGRWQPGGIRTGSRCCGGEQTAGDDGAVLFMQNDGNLVVRGPGNIPSVGVRDRPEPGTVLQVAGRRFDGAVTRRGTLPCGYSCRCSSTWRPHSYVGRRCRTRQAVDSEASDYVYDGHVTCSCASVGKAVEHFLPEAYGVGIEHRLRDPPRTPVTSRGTGITSSR